MSRFVSALLALLLAGPAIAQPNPQFNQTQTYQSFTPTGRATDLSATTATSRVALGSSAGVAWVCNTGATNTVYVQLGTVTVTAVVATSFPIPAGRCAALNSTGATHIAGITASSTTTVQTVLGTGSPGAALGTGSGGGGGSGTVTSVSVVTANGLAGSVATATSTPAITLSTSVTGNVCGDGTALSACSTTGTGATVLANTPTLITPNIGVATGTSLALSGVALGTNKLAVAGTGLFNLNAAAAPAGATGTGVQLVGTDATVGRYECDSFAAICAFTARRANGTGASPTALASSDQIGAFNFHGYYVTGGPGYSSVQASIAALATQNWTSTNQGTQILLRTTPNNSTTLTTALTIGQDQSVAMAGTSTIATSLAIGGATIGTDALGVTGTARISAGMHVGPFGLTIYTSGVTGNRSVLVADNLGGNIPGMSLRSAGVIAWGSGSDTNSLDTMLSRNAAGVQQFGTTVANAAGSWLATNGTLSGALVVSGTADASAVTGSGALQVAGGASIAKRLWIPAITASAGLQTAVLCQSSGGEMIADSVACLASSERFKMILGVAEPGALDSLMRLPIRRWRYNEEGIFQSKEWTRERLGPTAEDAAAIDPRLVGYDSDGKIRNISTEQLLSLTIQAIQELKADNDNLRETITKRAANGG